jgi:Thioredoxin
MLEGFPPGPEPDTPTAVRFPPGGYGRSVATVPQAQLQARPRLVFFYSPLSGRCRRLEGFIAQVLQRRQNHDTFDLVRVSVDRRPDLAEKFRVEDVPTICVVEGRTLLRTIVTPRGCRELERELEPWLR